MIFGRSFGMNRLAVVSILLVAAGCQSATEVQITDLEGAWVASEARVEDLAGYKLGNFDLVEEGYTVTFVSPGDGRFTLSLIPPDGDPQVIGGTMEIDGTDTMLTTDGSVTSGEVFHQDDQAALSLTAGLTWDFSGNGQEVPAKLLIVMDRIGPEAAPL
ncbi:MAG: hypothetical protein M8861_10215 [marine benthic group bacterium]|nr:hypothetical protein [Gemmatimonadota bacterium]